MRVWLGRSKGKIPAKESPRAWHPYSVDLALDTTEPGVVRKGHLG